ncbi:MULTISPECIES: hypothetical protein [unclassified Paenibacillus]|uniref:hypothetical protein n=1 Tax=unclassified Paenibacillus TaxID=185978 RepID=UPI0015E396FA|nr:MULTISPECIES: hypothetical protein [unclassified Paenibacillus]MBD8837016.1 hypothetical protein [Paenibacillus sp. CFBP 13594]QZN74499.1 hypothetical protein K5K90_24330 [Paenibacillus sp. DR312]
MTSKDRTKQLLHDQFIRLLHVYENHKNTEIEHFLSIAQRESIEKIPQHLSLAELIRERRSIRKCNSTPVDQKLVVDYYVRLIGFNHLVRLARGVWYMSELQKHAYGLVDCMLEQMSQSKLGKLIPVLGSRRYFSSQV